MSAVIGFDRPIQLDWLDLIASRLAETGDPDRAWRDTRHIIESAVGGGDSPHNATGKRMTILRRVWLRVPDEVVGIRDAAASALVSLTPDERLAVHWAMCELAYPFYLDATSTVGRALALSDTVTLGLIRDRLVERWGSLGSMPAATQRLLKMWDTWGVLVALDGRGTYGGVPARVVGPVATAIVVGLRVRAERTRSADVDDLQRTPDLFPFALQDVSQSARAAPGLQVERGGGRRLVVRAVDV